MVTTPLNIDRSKIEACILLVQEKQVPHFFLQKSKFEYAVQISCSLCQLNLLYKRDNIKIKLFDVIFIYYACYIIIEIKNSLANLITMSNSMTKADVQTSLLFSLNSAAYA